MSLLAPLWLLALLPWAAVTAWLLRGRGEQVPVPFLELWRGTALQATRRRALRPPPAAVVCLLGAMLLGIVAAAQPVIRGGGEAVAVTVVLDRGITMSAIQGEQTRLAALLENVVPQLREAFGDARVELLVVPGEAQAVGLDDLATVSVNRTAMQTKQLLRQTVAEALRAGEEPVIVLSDQPLELDDERLVQISPDRVPANVSVAHVAARETPRAQVMLTLRNQSSLRSAMLRIRSEHEASDQAIDLPAINEQRDYFFDLSEIGQWLQVGVVVDDDLELDNTAWLVRTQSWPRIVKRPGLPPAVLRVLAAYEKNRPAGDGSKQVVVAEARELAEEDAGIAMAPVTVEVDAAIEAVAHELTEMIDWSALAGARASDPPQGQWQALVRAGERVLLAAREAPARQVWIGFEAPGWHESAEFVIFWSSALEWVGEGGEELAALPVQRVPAQWQWVQGIEPVAPTDMDYRPGLLRRSDGRLVALNAQDVQFAEMSAVQWVAPLGVLAAPQRAAWSLSPALLLAALGLGLLSAVAWRSGAATSAAAMSAAADLPALP